MNKALLNPLAKEKTRSQTSIDKAMIRIKEVRASIAHAEKKAVRGAKVRRAAHSDLHRQNSYIRSKWKIKKNV